MLRVCIDRLVRDGESYGVGGIRRLGGATDFIQGVVHVSFVEVGASKFVIVPLEEIPIVPQYFVEGCTRVCKLVTQEPQRLLHHGRRLGRGQSEVVKPRKRPKE